MDHKLSADSKSDRPLGLSEISASTELQKMNQWFLRFSEQTSGSPMYQYLSKAVADDPQMLTLAGHSNPKQPAPNLFFAAVHFLLQLHPGEALAKYYPSLGGRFTTTQEVFSVFKDFCHKFEKEICELLQSRLVQTSEVQRCALLLPAINLISQETNHPNLALVDVGSSGGLNLLMDQVYIEYSDGTILGTSQSLLHLQCESRGLKLPNFNTARIATRIGVDLNTVNLLEASERQWNLALIWPDQLERIERVQMALKILEKNSIIFHQGNANDVLAKVIAEIPQDQIVCVIHSFTLNQFSKEDRENFDLLLSAESKNREIWRVSLEWIGTPNPELIISQYKSGQKMKSQKIAECHGHGDWISWLGGKQWN